MFRSVFGDPKPVGFDELIEALDEVFGDYGGEKLSANISFQSPGNGNNHFDGWSADIDGHNDDDEFFELSTGGYEDASDLYDDLEAVGVPMANIRMDPVS